MAQGAVGGGVKCCAGVCVYVSVCVMQFQSSGKCATGQKNVDTPEK